MSSEIGLDNDTRIIKRNIAKGLVSRASVSDLMTDLPDVADQAAQFLWASGDSVSPQASPVWAGWVSLGALDEPA